MQNPRTHLAPRIQTCALTKKKKNSFKKNPELSNNKRFPFSSSLSCVCVWSWATQRRKEEKKKKNTPNGTFASFRGLLWGAFGISSRTGASSGAYSDMNEKKGTF